jgi:parallel beta-helix repeat protein
MTASPQLFIIGNTIVKAHDKGISIGEMSNAIIVNNTVISSATGIAIKDMSDPLLINNTLINNSIGLAAFEKNWKYGGGGRGVIRGTNFCQNVQPVSIQNDSLVRIEQDGKIINCSEKECPFSCEI